MFKVKIKNVYVAWCFSFFATITLMLLLERTNYALLCLIACIIHELGHILVMCWCGIPPKQIIFYGAGIKIIPNYEKIVSLKQDFFVLIAGSLTNIILFALLYGFFHSKFYFAIFAIINLIIGIFNLIPFKYFDGGRIIDLFLSVYAKDNIIIIRKIIRVISIVLLILLALILAIIKVGNISLYISIGYIIFSELIL